MFLFQTLCYDFDILSNINILKTNKPRHTMCKQLSNENDYTGYKD